MKRISEVDTAAAVHDRLECQLFTQRGERCVKHRVHTGPESPTVQADKNEVDVNTIMKRFGVYGQLPLRQHPGMYGDFSGVVDYQTALNAVIRAGEAFDRLPAHVRAEFENDPQKFLEFVQDDRNYDRAAELGLVPKKKDPPSEGGTETPPEGGSE